ncbi:MAG: alpha/beta fold hydrolase [Bacteroides sp.]|jgi:pimeloyl-ACP methyl ester carboxylesterase|nr:alpha/beta fold hydrolase [Bacteroides sp.]
MEKWGKQAFIFPVGYEAFHKKQLYNFQLNRPYSFGYARREDLWDVGKRIHSFSDWTAEMLKLATTAEKEGRLMNAAFYYRAAEFYLKWKDALKSGLYETFISLFDQAFEGDDYQRHLIPYENALLSALRINPKGDRKGTLVIHGGFDSLIEEFYSMMWYFASRGYEVIGFEGPGQGASLRKHGLPITIAWEKPVRAILDHFGLEDVTLIGLSMGGWFCLRAASFEERVKRVIANGHAIDYMKSMPGFLRKIHLWSMTRWPGMMNRMAEWKFSNREGVQGWMVDQLKFITQKTKALEALDLYLQLNTENIRADQVKQDVLILSGSHDHFIPRKMHGMQLKALVNARSVTGKMFYPDEQAENHCQIGNFELGLRTMADWLNGFQRKE